MISPHFFYQIYLLYAPSHRQDSTYHDLCYTNRGAHDSAEGRKQTSLRTGL